MEIRINTYDTPKKESKPKFHDFYHIWTWVFCITVIILDFLALIFLLVLVSDPNHV